MAGHKRRRWVIALLVGVAVALAAWGCYVYRIQVQGNFGVVVDGQVYRSAQPTPEHIRKWAGQYGLKTIVNLRGVDEDSVEGERQAAREANVNLVEARCSARELPSTLWVRQMVEILETSPRPMLIHCHAGADRTGVASVLAAMAVGGQDYSQAKAQMSARYTQIDFRAGNLAGLLEKYEQYCRDKSLPTAGWTQFRKWAVEVYHPRYYRLEIRVPEEVRCVSGRPIEVAVVVRNASDEVLPAGDAARKFTLVCFTGSSITEKPDQEFGARVPMPRRDLKPGEQVELKYTIQPPQGGSKAVHFDLIEEGKTWFGRQGSPVATCKLTVTQP